METYIYNMTRDDEYGLGMVSLNLVCSMSNVSTTRLDLMWVYEF